MKSKKQILAKDKKFLWHPFTQSSSDNPIVISSAKDEKLFDIDGNEYVDLISSWWVNTHGHCRNEMINSVFNQSKKLEQVLFAGFTHDPAVDLAGRIVDILPKNLSRVFYSDNGSTSVEVAMKVAIQYWYNVGKKKTKFIALSGGYHGDTFGAMSVGKTTGFYKPFEKILNKNFFIPFPEDWWGNNQVEENERLAIDTAHDIVEKEKDQIAAVILEPLVQGAGGMKICRKEFLDKLVKIFKDLGILVIFDEVMTGFGRTGKMFATDHLTMTPDIICLAKSLTGGFIPLAATVFSEEIHKVFVDTNFNKTFLHGHSFSANPVACAAALSSLNLFKKDETFSQIDEISQIHKDCLKKISKLPDISRIRKLGTIAAFDFKKISGGYGSSESIAIRKKFLESGLLLRPLGNTIYLMPPYCIKKENLINSYEKLIEILQ
tara:strand:- start:3 stop:1304 length:1302 start_codon:yes stop_codon:yes gene_type:complete